MNRSIGFHLTWTAAFLAPLFLASMLVAQDTGQTSGFYDVAITKSEIYSYSNLKFDGDYISFQSPAGHLALGRTEAGVTAVVVVGDGTCNFTTPDPAQDKFKSVFGNYPLKASFKSIYLRLNPREYEEVFATQQLTKTTDDAAFAKAKALFDQDFLSSYHAGTKALLPPYKTRYFEFETTEAGHITNEEGYWLVLRRLSPFGSVYPSRFVNPKQRFEPR